MESTIDLRIVRGVKTRRQIISAALSLLTEGGPKGFTAGKLAKKAKISKANLFHHFKRIDDVPFAVLEEMFGQFSTMMNERKHKSIAAYVDSIGQGILSAPPEQRKIAAVFVQFYLRSAHDEAFRAQQEKMTLLFIRTLEEGFETVLARPLTHREKEVAPRLVAICLEGLSFLGITVKEREVFSRAWRALSEFIDGYLKDGR